MCSWNDLLLPSRPSQANNQRAHSPQVCRCPWVLGLHADCQKSDLTPLYMPAAFVGAFVYACNLTAPLACLQEPDLPSAPMARPQASHHHEAEDEFGLPAVPQRT